jgi:hypothetical protein
MLGDDMAREAARDGSSGLGVIKRAADRCRDQVGGLTWVLHLSHLVVFR